MAYRKKNLLILLFLTSGLMILYFYLNIFDWTETSSASESEGSQIKENSNFTSSVVCVLVLACRRPTVKRCIDSIFKSRSLTKSHIHFPLIVSQDCGRDPRTTKVLKSYGERIHHVYVSVVLSFVISKHGLLIIINPI